MFRELYHRYLTLRLPWRRNILAGTDLSSRNTYWQFTIPGTTKPRRVALPYTPGVFKSPSFAHTHPSELEKMEIPPQWIQWLKYVRHDAPTLDELRMDVERRKVLKAKVEQVEERWRSEKVRAVGEGAASGASQIGLLEQRRNDSQTQTTDSGRVTVTHEDMFGQTSKPQIDDEQEPAGSPWKQATQSQDEPVPWTPKTSKRS